jgi:hypothetical protein
VVGKTKGQPTQQPLRRGWSLFGSTRGASESGISEVGAKNPMAAASSSAHLKELLGRNKSGKCASVVSERKASALSTANFQVRPASLHFK